MDTGGVRCARCGGPLAVRSEQIHVNEDTNRKLLAHSDKLRTFEVILDPQKPLGKTAEGTMAAAALVLHVADSLQHGVQRSLIHYLRDLTIPEEQILRLRLDDPEKISALIQEPTVVKKGKPLSRPAARSKSVRPSEKRLAKRPPKAAPSTKRRKKR
jgi:hypothetical protein